MLVMIGCSMSLSIASLVIYGLSSIIADMKNFRLDEDDFAGSALRVDGLSLESCTKCTEWANIHRDTSREPLALLLPCTLSTSTVYSRSFNLSKCIFLSP